MGAKSFTLIFFLLFSKVCQFNTLLKGVEDSKAELAELDALANNENLQIEKDEQKKQSEARKEEKMIRDLEESIRHAEQQLRQVVSTIFNWPLWQVTKHLIDMVFP